VVDLPLCKMMEFVNGKDDIPYMKWNNKNMFETTNLPITMVLVGDISIVYI